jgi:hypothetical protein
LKVRRTVVKRILLLLVICFCISSTSLAFINNIELPVATVTSTRQQAITFIDSIKKLDSSASWPNIKPSLFLQNLKTSIYQPVSIYPGNGTNFCAYGALTYLFLQDDPLGYAKLLLQLYQQGKARFGNASFTPSAAIKKQAGLLRYKGVLDVRPAEQMWYLCLADHYKGYLNIFNRRYNNGDEDRFWASVNYAKFNRMVKGLLRYKVKAKGADWMHPHVSNMYEYISDQLTTGRVVLFINNRIVHKKNHVKIKVALPTHFIVVEKISKQDDLITLVYWDYGGKTLLQLSPSFLRRITFGITHFSKKENDAN